MTTEDAGYSAQIVQPQLLSSLESWMASIVAKEQMTCSPDLTASTTSAIGEE